MTHRPHRYAVRDENHVQLAADLRACGFTVLDVSAVGGLVLDLLVIGYDERLGCNILRMVEAKRDEDAPVTLGEKMMLQQFPGVCKKAVVVEDVLRAYGRVG